MDLTEFITARLDEDEDAALDVRRGNPGPWSVEGSSVRNAAGDVVVHDEYGWTALRYIARHDPARVLREVEAKRAILARLGNAPADAGMGEHLQRSQEQSGIWVAMHLLAAVWSDHPDYRDEWHA